MKTQALARIRYMEHEGKYRGVWRTVSECEDTPQARAAALKQARAQHAGKTLWIWTEGKHYVPK
jgi:hypothetical protein